MKKFNQSKSTIKPLTTTQLEQMRGGDDLFVIALATPIGGVTITGTGNSFLPPPGD